MKFPSILACVLLAAISISGVAVADESKSQRAAPELLTSDIPVATPDVFTFGGESDGGCNCDPQLMADVIESLRYLHERQVDILERLEKVESALIRVSTKSGTVTRTVAMQNGGGDFVLGPGERVTAVRDVVTGQWVSVGSSTVSPSATTLVSTSTTSRGVVQGRVTTRAPLFPRMRRTRGVVQYGTVQNVGGSSVCISCN
jgi:hypothetical protein